MNKMNKVRKNISICPRLAKKAIAYAYKKYGSPTCFSRLIEELLRKELQTLNLTK
jgi:hypothetical protein